MLKSEEKSALDKINRNNTAGRDGIVIEILSDLDNLEFDKIKKRINENIPH